MKSLIKKIKEHEGYRSTVYQCTEGFDTIGYGFAIKDLKLSEEICDIILAEKLAKLQFDISNKFEWFDDSPILVKMLLPICAIRLDYQAFLSLRKLFIT